VIALFMLLNSDSGTFVVAEIELLLTPEEEAILDQNETADVTKISSVECVLLSYHVSLVLYPV
jgi:hypothetical protein